MKTIVSFSLDTDLAEKINDMKNGSKSDMVNYFLRKKFGMD